MPGIWEPNVEWIIRELWLKKHSLWLFMATGCVRRYTWQIHCNNKIYYWRNWALQNLSMWPQDYLYHLVSALCCHRTTFAYPRIIMLVIIKWRWILLFILIYNNIWTIWFSVYNPGEIFLFCCALYPTPKNSFSLPSVVNNATGLSGSSSRNERHLMEISK